MKIPSTRIHLTGKLITPQLSKLIEDKAKTFRSLNLYSANFPEVVGCMTGFEFIKTTKDCGGYCNAEKKIIALNSTAEDEELRTKNFGLFMPQSNWNKATIMHEIGHALQAELGVMAKDTWLLSYKLQMEWQAESIAYQLYNKCFGKLSHRFFNSYFSESDVSFLKNWYNSCIENDTKL